jgi:apolipoprotein N-acyltransferase
MKVYRRPSFLLFAGVVLLVGTHMTIGIGLLAWIAYVPFLLYLHQTEGWQSRLWFALAYLLAWSLTVAKIITDPLPLFLVPLYAVPITLFQLPAFLLWGRFRRQRWALFLFPALLVVLEWIQYTFTPFASWGAAAYSQLDQLVLVQAVSLFGMAGLGFLIYWVNAALAALIIDGKNGWKQIGPPLIVLLLAGLFGALRYDLSQSKGQPTMLVAAVGTDSEVGAGPLPAYELRQRNAATLFARTRQAAQAGAELIVWNEGAAAVLPAEEPLWQDSLVALATECQVPLVAAYVSLLSEAPLRYENKYVFVKADGSIADTYLKHEPVPGEPAVKGTAPFVAYPLGDVTLGGAICYDYDFPYVARALGQLEVDLVALPSSDWRGIDPIHTKMAAFRAVEQGHSVLRSTRFGRSAAITPYGEMVAQMSSFDQNDKIMLAHLPRNKRVSLYRIIGDAFVYLCIAFLLGVPFYFQRRKHQAAPDHS